MGINGAPWAFDPNNPNPRTPQQQLEDYLKTLPPEERARYRRNQRQVLAGRIPADPPAQQPAPQPAAPAPQQQQQQQDQQEGQRPLVLAPAMHVHMPEADERSPLERMGDNVEDAYRRENDSRVEQAREARRLGFARDMEAMRQEGLLQRLQAMNESSYEPAQRPQSGGIGVFNPYTHQFEYGSQLVNENGVRYLDGRRLD